MHEIGHTFYASNSPLLNSYLDYAWVLAACILSNVKEGRHYDDISSLQVC